MPGEEQLVLVYEVIERSNISQELLSKIRFLITNQYINPYTFKVSLKTEVFYNTETSEMLEVVKNELTGKYEIKKDKEIASIINQEKEKDTDEEEQLYSKQEGKIRVLAQPKKDYSDTNNRAAFVKISFLIITTFLVSIGIALLLLLLK